MKRKPAKRTRKKPPALSAKPLRELWERLSDPAERQRLTLQICSPFQVVPGIALPPDLEEALRFLSRERTSDIAFHLQNPPAIPVDDMRTDYELAFEPLELKEEHVWEIALEIKSSIRVGFNLALLRYADDLKNVPEAAALLEQKRAAARKGGAGRRKKAEPNHKAICKRFRELRKTIPKKTVRYLRVAEEYGMSDRHVARIVDGID